MEWHTENAAHAPSLAGSTPTRICMSLPSSMSTTGFWERRCFATTRQGYRQMLAWMRSFGELQRVGIESTGSYGAGLLRFMQHAGVEVLEVTAPDKQDRRRRGKNDDLDAQNAAHAAFAGKRTVTPQKPRRHDRGPARAQGLPQDGRRGAARRPADDPQHDRLRAR